MTAVLEPANEDVEELPAEQVGKQSQLIRPRGKEVQVEEDEEREEGYQEDEHQRRGKPGFFLARTNSNTI